MPPSDHAPTPRGGYAVLLVAYGTPRNLDEVEPYLLDVRGGRATPPELVAELRERYARVGGTSPLLDRTREQADALRRRLGDGTPVRIGMRHWHPYIRDTLAQLRAEGISRVVALPLAPHYSRLSIGAYAGAIEAARGPIEVAMVHPWHDHCGFLDAVAERVGEALARFDAERRDAVSLLFTAHSLPARILDEGDPYLDQLKLSVAGVMARLPAGSSPRVTRLAFQSAGRSPEPWLGPDAGAVLEELASLGRREVLLCPIGFVSDHLEVCYDVDIELQAVARRLGIRLERTESLNASPVLIEALADLIRRITAEREWTQ